MPTNYNAVLTTSIFSNEIIRLEAEVFYSD